MAGPKRFPLHWQMLVAIVVGVIAGLLIGPKAKELAPIGKYIVKIIRTAAVPLLFFAIFDGVMRAEFKGRGLGRLVFVIVLNGSLAVTIALVISNLFQPGLLMPLGTLSGLAEHGVGSMFKKDKIDPLPIAIVSALSLGALILLFERFRRPRPPFARLRKLSSQGFALTVKLLEILILLVPIAVFVAAAGITGAGQYKKFAGLLVYFATCVSGLLLQIGLVYQSWLLLARIGLRNFWSAAKTPVIYSFGINSSLATLPVTLKALDQLKVSAGSARLAACVGTNFNNDGILLYEVVACLFMAQAYGLQLDLMQQLTIAALCMIAMVGVGGIPEAGLISLTMVLGTVGLPAEHVPTLFLVNWFIARLRSVTNVCGDMTGAVALDWLDRRKAGGSVAPV